MNSSFGLINEPVWTAESMQPVRKNVKLQVHQYPPCFKRFQIQTFFLKKKKINDNKATQNCCSLEVWLGMDISFYFLFFKHNKITILPSNIMFKAGI
jgi:hypothetical protein